MAGGKGRKTSQLCWTNTEPWWWIQPQSNASIGVSHPSVPPSSTGSHRRVPLHPEALLQGIHVRASGDGSSAPARYCRLCSAEQGLHRITSRCPWSGQDTYDQIISENFGVIVPPDCQICDRCVALLRSSQKLRTLVHAAFGKVWSECASLHTGDITTTQTSVRTLKEDIVSKTSDLPHPISEIIRTTDDNTVANKKILELLSKKVATNTNKKERIRKRSMSNSNNTISKRTIVSCTICGQRYPMLSSTENTTGFICSRCKLKRCKEKPIFSKKCNTTVHANIKEHMNEHAKGDTKKLRAKRPQVHSSDTATLHPYPKTIFQCAQYPKKNMLPKHLPEHAKKSHCENAHRCKICRKEVKTKVLLDQHMKIHSGEALFECDICKRIFKGKSALRLHYLTHENFRLTAHK